MTENQLLVEKLTSIEQLLSSQGLLRKEIFSLTEACQYLSVSDSYMYKLTSTRQVPHYCPTGKKLYFKKSELDQWLLSNRQDSDAEIHQKAADYLIKNRRG